MRYIGSRYPVAIWDNPDNRGSAEWQPGYSYEAMLVVTRLNNCYTSKRPVPATVGAPEDNPDYWIISANYNAFVAELSDKVDGFEDDVANLDTKIGDLTDLDTEDKTSIVNAINELVNQTPTEAKHVLICSDSYGVVVNNVVPYSNLLKAKIEATAGNSCYTFSMSSVGYNRHAPATGMNALEMVQSMASQITNPEEITDVISTIGINDTVTTDTITQVKNDMQAFISYIKTTYPNAKLHFGFAGRGGHLDEGTNIYRYLSLIQMHREVCNANEIDYILNIEKIMCNALLQSDDLHPNTNGANYLCNFIYNHVFNNKCNNDYTAHKVSTLSVGSDTLACYESINGDTTEITIPTLPTAVSLNVGFTTVGTFSDSMFYGYSNGLIPILANDGSVLNARIRGRNLQVSSPSGAASKRWNSFKIQGPTLSF